MIGHTIETIQDRLQEAFSGLYFDEARHRYEHEGKVLPSVSYLIKRYVEPFNTKKIAEQVAKKRGIPVEEVLEEWDNKKNAACERGNNAHFFGEKYMPGSDLEPKTGFDKAIIAFWEDIPEHIVPLAFELRMFSRGYGYAGTADLILLNTRTGKIIIVDYKTNEDLFKNFKGKRLLGAFNKLLDSPYNKYQLQLSLYQILLEQAGFEIERRKIVWLREDGTYHQYDTQDFTQTLKYDLKLN